MINATLCREERYNLVYGQVLTNRICSVLPAIDVVSLSKRSFHACDASHLNRGPDKRKGKKKIERNPPEADVKVIVNADYIHNLPEAVGKSNVNKDSLTVTPINLAKVILGNDTPHYVCLSRILRCAPHSLANGLLWCQGLGCC